MNRDRPLGDIFVIIFVGSRGLLHKVAESDLQDIGIYVTFG